MAIVINSKYNSFYFISLSKFNLPLIGTFMWPTPSGPYRATTCRGRELNYGSHTYFFDHTSWRASPDEGSAQCRATSETAQTWKIIHTKHTLRHPNKANMEWWWRQPNVIRGSWGPKVSWHLSYRWGKTPKKNLTQETFLDRGSNPGPLRDKRACYQIFANKTNRQTSITSYT